jgi:hypothetical protein
MKSRCRKRQARGNIIVNYTIFRLQLIALQVIKASEHGSENDVEFTIGQAVSVSGHSWEG